MLGKQPRNFYCKGSFSTGMQDEKSIAIWREGSHKVGISLKLLKFRSHLLYNLVLKFTGFVSLFVYLLQLIWNYFQSSGLALCSFRREHLSYLHSDLDRFPCENKLADSNPRDYKVASLNGPHTWTSSFHQWFSIFNIFLCAMVASICFAGFRASDARSSSA